MNTFLDEHLAASFTCVRKASVPNCRQYGGLTWRIDAMDGNPMEVVMVSKTEVVYYLKKTFMLILVVVFRLLLSILVKLLFCNKQIHIRYMECLWISHFHSVEKHG